MGLGQGSSVPLSRTNFKFIKRALVWASADEACLLRWCSPGENSSRRTISEHLMLETLDSLYDVSKVHLSYQNNVYPFFGYLTWF